MDRNHNNLDRALSPYLRQHSGNPVWWQEWDEEVLAYAVERGKGLFVSVGYATCHWCHVMAAEAFSDTAVAAYLNEHFVSIKVDREERPDIDHYLMQYLLATRGNGGWPLNAFLAGPGKPVLALTYLAVGPRGDMPGFVDVARQVNAFLEERQGNVREFQLASAGTEPVPEGMVALVEALQRSFDGGYGGFGQGAKFPPHSTLLFLLHAADVLQEHGHRDAVATADRIVRETLHGMIRSGLHDHLQGGFFRYCVDRAWQIPHFEKMLYDQALLLWVLALAWRRYGDEAYRAAAAGIVTALDESFADGALFISGHDADTNHEEGQTYLWDTEELKLYGPVAEELFDLTPGGNFEGRHHLIRRESGPFTPEEEALRQQMLNARRQRPQPSRDRKAVTAWNALAGIALVEAGRAFSREQWISRGARLFDELLQRNNLAAEQGGIVLCRSTLEYGHSRGEFLEDYAAVLLLASYLYEEGLATDGQIRILRERVLSFYGGAGGSGESGGWNMARTTDFPQIPADLFDAPTPSAPALSELALLRCSWILEELAELPGGGGAAPTPGAALGAEQVRDFHNIAVLLSAGELPVLHRRIPLPWQAVPVGTMQIPAEREEWCFRGVCHSGRPPLLPSGD